MFLLAVFFFYTLTDNLCLYFTSFTPAFYPGFCVFPLIPWIFILILSYTVNASRILIHNLHNKHSGGAVVGALGLNPWGPEAYLCGVFMLAPCPCGFSPVLTLIVSAKGCLSYIGRAMIW